jgi:hypothetical protein
MYWVALHDCRRLWPVNRCGRALKLFRRQILRQLQTIEAATHATFDDARARPAAGAVGVRQLQSVREAR